MKTETKDLGMEIHPGEGVVKEEKFPHSRKPSDRHVCRELWNLRWQHNWGVKKKKRNTHTHTEYAPNCNYQQGGSPDFLICHQ